MNPNGSPRASDTTTATLLMLASAMLFGMMAITIRYASQEMHPFEVAFFRNLFGFLFALPLLARTGTAILRTNKFGLYLMRCAIGMVSMLCGFWAIANLPLAQAVALSYSTPLFVTIGAVLVLHEVVRARRWSAVLIGFVGVLVIVRPFGDAFTAGSLVAVTAAVFSASVAISIKFLSRTEAPDAIVLWTTMLWVPMSLVPALFFWTWPSAAGWAWVALTGFFGTAAHMCWTRAFKLGDASALTPLSFVQLPVVAILAWLLFDESMDRWVMLGAAIIFGSNLYIARREAALARRAVTDRDIGSDNPPTAR